MIAKLVVHGRDRTEALRMLRKGLDEYRVVGLHTNVEFLRALAGNPAFIDGEVETGFIPVCFITPLVKRAGLLTCNCTSETPRSALPSHRRASA